jgi:hypothetical protein
MEDLKGFKKSLEALDRRFEEWIAPINEVEQSTMFKVNKDGYTLADAKREVDEVVRKQLSQYDPYPEMYSLIDSLCGFYLETSPKNRARIRRTVRDKNGVWSALINYIYWAAAHLASPPDDKWLCQGLAAVSIEDCNFDYRDTLWPWRNFGWRQKGPVLTLNHSSTRRLGCPAARFPAGGVARSAIC